MATARIEQLINEVTGIANCDSMLARLWVRDAARRSIEARNWSFLMRRGQFTVPALVSNTTTGATCSVFRDRNVVTFSGAVADASWIGRQFRISADGPIYDVIDVASSTSITISPVYGSADAAAQPFSVFKAYLAVPADCLMLVSVVDPQYRRQLRLQTPHEELDRYDSSRSRQGGAAVCLSPLDYTSVPSGTVTPLRWLVDSGGGGSKPIISGTYIGETTSIFSVQIIVGGVGGVATFLWQRDEDGWAAAVSDADVPVPLSDGISVTFGSADVYAAGDMFASAARPVASPGVPRYELYPYQTVDYVFPYLCVTRYPDVTGDDNIELPGLFATRDDIIREKALEFAATQPGTDERPNTYAQINRRDYHAANWQTMVDELAVKDNEIFQQNVGRSMYFSLPFASLPWASGTDLQSQDPLWLYPDAYPALY